MKVRLQSGGALKPDTVVDDVDSVVLELDSGDPVFVALNISGQIWLSNCQEPDFEANLELLGMSAAARSHT